MVICGFEYDMIYYTIPYLSYSIYFDFKTLYF